MDIWRNIIGFPGYQVSTSGNIRSYKNYQGAITDICHILRPRTNPNGYKVVVLHDANAIPHQLSVHRLVAQTFMPVDDPTLVVDHLDCDKSNNALNNLEWVTSRENSHRAFRAGLYENAFAVTRRPVLVTDLRDGNEMFFNGVNEAARTLGFSPAILSRAANALADKVGHYTVEFVEGPDTLLYRNNYI